MVGKILTGCLFIIFLAVTPAAAQSHVITYSAREKSLSRILEEISAKYQLKFAFDAEVISAISTTVKFRNESLQNVISYLSEKHALEFRLMDGTWVVLQKRGVQQLPEKTIEKAEIPVITKRQFSGYISDQTTGEPLYYCAVIFPGNRGTLTNELGFFHYETAADSVRFYITHLGFQRLDTVIATNTPHPVQIGLKPFVMLMEEVDVIRKETNTIELPRFADRIGFNPAQSANMPRLANDDLVNMLTLIPGVGFLPGNTGGLTIRGSNPSENLVLLDGISLLETGHLFGNVSALNAGFIRQAFVSRGGFDTRYGDKTSGLIELTGKSGPRSSPSLETSFNLLNGDIIGTVPLGQKWLVSGAYRRSFMDFWPNYLFRKLITESRLTNVNPEAINVLPIIRYQDFNFKTTFTPSPNQEFSLNLIHIDDQQMLDYNAETSLLYYRNEWVRRKNTGAGFTWSLQTGRWHHMVTSAYTSLAHYQEQETGEEKSVPSSWSSFFDAGKKTGWFKKLKEYIPTRTIIKSDNDSNRVQEFKLEYNAEWKKANFVNQVGLGFTNDNFRFRIWADNTEWYIPTDSLFRTSRQRSTYSFFQQNVQLFKQLNIRWGLRVNWDDLTEKLYLQPRGGLEYTPLENLKIYYYGGIYHQFLSKIPLIDYTRNVDMVWFLPDTQGNGVLKSGQHSAGVQWTTGGFLINAEGYLKSTSGKRWLNAETYRERLRTRIRYVYRAGYEENYGVDVFAQFRHPHFTHQAGYSWAVGREKVEGINRNAWFPSLNNHRHQLQLSEMFTMKGFVASVLWNYRSGQPRILPSPNSSALLIERLDYFSQLDASLAKTFLFEHAGITCGFSLLNVLNRLNVVQVDNLQILGQLGSYTITSNVSSLSFTPVFFVKCRFY